MGIRVCMGNRLFLSRSFSLSLFLYPFAYILPIFECILHSIYRSNISFHVVSNTIHSFWFHRTRINQNKMQKKKNNLNIVLFEITFVFVASLYIPDHLNMRRATLISNTYTMYRYTLVISTNWMRCWTLIRKLCQIFQTSARFTMVSTHNWAHTFNAMWLEFTSNIQRSHNLINNNNNRRKKYE